jgi:hypothetical protein
VDRQALASEYENRSDDELLRLVMSPDNLMPEAREVLTMELRKRGIATPQRLADFCKQEQDRKEEIERTPGSLFTFRGIGRSHYGKADRNFDVASGITTFRTTVFLVFLYSPLIPSGTYLVQQRPDEAQVTFRKKLPLDWEQILKVWVVTAAVWLAVMLSFKLLEAFLLR